MEKQRTRQSAFALLLLNVLRLFALPMCLLIGSFETAAQEKAVLPTLTYLVIDKSGSIQTGGLMDPILGAVTEFVGTLGTNSELRVVFFNDRATKEQAWKPPLETRAKGEFIRRMQRDFQPAGQTRLFDTLGEVLETVIAEKGKYSKIDIKILSDGDDNRSTKFTSWEMLTTLSKQFVTGHDNFITWITLGFDPGNKKPSSDSGIVMKLFPDATKGFSIVEGPMEAKPIAAFDATPKTVKVGAQVAFRLIYPKGVTAARWRFGDGKVAEGTGAQHSFEKSGFYSIRAEVEGPGGKDALEMADFVQVLDQVPVRAAFSASPRKAKVGEEVLFALDSTAGATTAQWDFGDGSTASSFVARHAYAKAGTYAVKVVVQGPDGADSADLTGGIEVFSELPVSASFSVSPRRAKVNEEVLFALDSSAGITSVRWNFGDGSSASNSLVRHSYSKVGDYDVAAEVSGPGGNDASTCKACIQIRAEVPLEPIFSWAPKIVIVGQEIEFIDESLGSPAKWMWEIPGAGIRSERNPSIIFEKAGKLSVRLTVEKEGQQRSVSKEIEVQPPPPPLLQSAFEAVPASGHSPLKVQFKDQSKGTIAAYSWDFGDGQTSDLRSPIHVYNVDGKAQDFRPRLTIRDSTGQEARDPGVVMISATPPPPWWRWPAAALIVALVLLVWFLNAVRPTRLVGQLAWQEQGQMKKRELEGMSFDLATLKLKAIPLGNTLSATNVAPARS